MSDPVVAVQPSRGRRDPAEHFSRAALYLALALLAATFLLISPQPGKTYPGAISWSSSSILHPIIDLMSLNGAAVTVRGVEIKDLALHLAAAVALLLVGLRAVAVRAAGVDAPPRGPGTWAQGLLATWVLISLLSSLWAGDADMARGQALLYALALCWAVSLAGNLSRWQVPALLQGAVIISALGALLCVWYYYERNPFHRPGFPLGNPNVVAAAILPATLLALATIASFVERAITTRRLAADWDVTTAALALVPLIWCLALTWARGALLALVAALVIVLVPRVLTLILGRWARAAGCVLALALLIGGGATWWLRAPHQDSMARDASFRVRLYAWRYAAELWGERQALGHGSGAYPRLAGAQAVTDQALDPAAFMGELVEHAHDELFEILTEIGLFGGVIYVGGMVATLLAGLFALRGSSGAEHWRRLGLLAGWLALVFDSFVEPTLRLPGGIAVFWTLVGIIWAVSRNGEPPTAVGAGSGPTRSPAMISTPWRALTALVCLAAACAAGLLAVRNWSGACLEQQANAAYEQKQYASAATAASDAEIRLLDPVRVIACRKLAVEARLAQAGEAVAAVASTQPASMPISRVTAALKLTGLAYDAAIHLGFSVPALTHSDALAARAAEWLVELNRGSDPSRAAEWLRKAEQAWRRQRQRTPYDVETLLALTRYPAPLEGHVALLRDALRFGETQGAWLKALNRLRSAPGFEQVLNLFVAAAGPITPETDLDALVASMAPETSRMAAACRALEGDFATAAARSAEAARLYRPMRPRFPKLYSIALAEQADYTLRGDPRAAPTAVALLRDSLAALPEIQAQKYEDMVRPFRIRLALALLAAEQTDDAVAVVESALGEQADDPKIVERVLEMLLRDAGSLGVDAELLQRVRNSLCTRFPGLCSPH